ncbi:hypothetical protein ACOACQ_16695 [Nocardioides sp. CPCC 206347]|uniref:hypothetical protein n=1 Tax=Nocardioides sp. CPCC 206347 TaxID=3406463 RepID=UPI003B4384DD
MSRRVWTWVAHVVAWSLLVAGVTVLFLERRSDDPEPAAAGGDARYAAMPFPSTLSLEGPDRGRIGSVFRFAAEGFSDKGLTSVTLYDGARPLDVDQPAGGSSSLQLPALSVGRHTVHAVLTDEDGKVSETAPVTVLVGQAPGDEDVPVPVPLLPDEDTQDVAERIGVPSADVLLGTGKARGTAVIQVAPDAGVALLNGPDLAIIDGPVLDGLTITAAGKGCGVTLEAKGAEELTFFRGGSAAGWVQVGRPQKDGRTDVPDLSPGTHVFFARAGKGASGELESGKVEVTVPDRCRDAFGWTGDASIVDGELAVPQANGLVFLHLSVDSRPWIRVPASQDELIAVGTRTSIAHLLPALNGRHLQFEVWRMSGDIPVRVASGELRVPSDGTLASVVGQPSAISLTVKTPDGPRTGIQLGTKHQELELDWAAASPAATRVRWQVLTTNSGASNLALNPPGLLASGVSEASGGGSGRSGSFTIDTASIPRADAKPAPSKGSGKGSGTGSVAVALQPPMPTGTLTDQASYGAIVPVTDLTEVAAPVELPVEGSTVYVRVVAEAGPAAASPSVFVQLPTHQSDKTGVDFAVNTVKVDAGRAPNPKAVGCLVVDVPWDKGPAPKWDTTSPTASQDFQSYVASQFYRQSGTYCPGAFPPPKGCDAWYCEVVDFIVDAAGAIVSVVVQVYELVSYAYNGVISGVVDIVSKLNPLCLALGAGGAGDAAKSCETVTGYATKAAIGAVLASVGLPPSLPSVEQLEAIASGELDQLAVELMKQLGVPCDAATPPAGFDTALATAGEELDAPVLAAAANPCLAVAHLLIGEVRAKATADAERAMADASGLPAFPDVPGFSMTADPRGLADPLTVEVSASVVDENADLTGIFCQVIVEDPHRSGVNSIGPYPWFTIQLRPTSSNGRTWKGTGARLPTIGATTVADLQGATHDVSARSYHPSDCRIPLTTEPVTVGPFDP